MLDKRTGKYYALKCFTEEQQGRADAYRQIADELGYDKESNRPLVETTVGGICLNFKMRCV